MAAIEEGFIQFIDVVKGDMFDISLDIKHNLNLTGKTLYSEVRYDNGKSLVLKFAEADGSLVKTLVSAQDLNLRFFKTASDMEIGTNTYQISVIMGTHPNYEDKQTIIKGTITIIPETTQKPIS